MKKQLLKKWQALLLVFFISHQIFAQDKTLTGKVTSGEDGTALVGANVVIKGTTRGTTTDATGSYKLSIPNNAVVVATLAICEKNSKWWVQLNLMCRLIRTKTH